MICGVGALVSVIDKLGGITMISSFLTDLMGEKTAVPIMELISAITATSFAAAISPLSTGGAIIMSSYSASKETTNAEMNKLFRNLFLLSVANVAVNVLLSALGVFSLGGLFY